MATKRAQPQRAGDFTGQQLAKQQAEHREEQKERADQISMANAVAAEETNTVVDLVDGGEFEVEPPEYVEEENGEEVLVPGQTPSSVTKTQVVGGIQELPVTVADAPTRIIRVNETMIDMNYGAGNFFTFEEGKKYRVPKDLADHLEEKGLVWH